MATRPVYHSLAHSPYYEQIDTDFEFFSGFSAAQKQKCIQSLHKEYLSLYPNCNVLEISSKSLIPLGVSLSAFHLTLQNENRIFSVECAFQSSKVFENGGPYTDLLEKSPRDAKRDERLHESGKLTAFRYFKEEFPLTPTDFFYNWLYLNALCQNKKLMEETLAYDSFTDIEFNPKKSINCQARSAAIFIGLSKQKLLEEAMSSRQKFLEIVYGKKTAEIL